MNEFEPTDSEVYIRFRKPNTRYPIHGLADVSAVMGPVVACRQLHLLLGPVRVREVTATVECRDQQHRIRLTPSGRLVLCDHPPGAKEAARRVGDALGGTTPRCLDVLYGWRVCALDRLPPELRRPRWDLYRREQMRAWNQKGVLVVPSGTQMPLALHEGADAAVMMNEVLEKIPFVGPHSLWAREREEHLGSRVAAGGRPKEHHPYGPDSYTLLGPDDDAGA